MDSRTSDSVGSGPGYFEPTAWSMILQAQRGNDPRSRACLEMLFHRYWRPVFFFVRRLTGNHENAKDLTQGFFATFLERRGIDYADRSRGRFRSFLIASVKRYMQEQHRARPPELLIAELEGETDRLARFDSAAEDPARAFMKNWAKSLVDTCMIRLREECRALRKGAHYDVFRRRMVDHHGESHEQTAAALGISQKDVNNYFERTKRRFARILHEEVRNSVLPDQDPDDEVKDLLQLLGG